MSTNTECTASNGQRQGHELLDNLNLLANYVSVLESRLGNVQGELQGHTPSASETEEPESPPDSFVGRAQQTITHIGRILNRCHDIVTKLEGF